MLHDQGQGLGEADLPARIDMDRCVRAEARGARGPRRRAATAVREAKLDGRCVPWGPHYSWGLTIRSVVPGMPADQPGSCPWTINPCLPAPSGRRPRLWGVLHPSTSGTGSTRVQPKAGAQTPWTSGDRMKAAMRRNASRGPPTRSAQARAAGERLGMSGPSGPPARPTRGPSLRTRSGTRSGAKRVWRWAGTQPSASRSAAESGSSRRLKTSLQSPACGSNAPTSR